MLRLTRYIVLLIALPAAAHCGQSPLRVFMAADGLGSNSIHRIVADSRGFLWFGTSEGLSRFDGHQFTTYGTAEGLPYHSVYDILEARNGIYWIASPGGLTRFDPNAMPPFHTFKLPPPVVTNWIFTMIEDGDGFLLCGGKEGLYRFATASGTFVRIDFAQRGENGAFRDVRALLKDRAGALWVASENGLYRRQGTIWQRFTTREGLPTNTTIALLQDSQGRLWAGTEEGLCQIAPDARIGRNSVLRTLRVKDGLPGDSVQSLFEQTGGHLWIGTKSGLCELPLHASSPRVFSAPQALGDFNTESLAEDRAGNLWIGTDGGGAMRKPREGFVGFSSADGLSPGAVVSIYESRQGEVWVITRVGNQLFMNRFGGERFAGMRMNLPKAVKSSGWGWGQIIAEDTDARLWVATGQGPAVFGKSAAGGAPGQFSHAALFVIPGTGSSNVFRLFFSSDQTMWISTSIAEGNSLASYRTAAGAFQLYSAQDGLLASKGALWGAFAEDHAGNLWIGSLRTGELLRYSKARAGRSVAQASSIEAGFKLFAETDGVPAGGIRWLYTDHSGRLWLASGGSGLLRIDEPASDHPRFFSYTTREGLSSNLTTCIAEDPWGRIYVGTGKGVDRIDPASGRIHLYTSADGLVGGEIQVGLSDRQGRIWFGGPLGVSYIVPEQGQSRPQPPVFITGARIAGNPFRVGAVGQTEVSGVELQPGRSQLRLEFTGLGSGAELRYRFMLEGADTVWSEPSAERSVEYAQLKPGKYRFQVKAITDDGQESLQPASFSFSVIAPVWQRWWFLTLAACTGILLISAAYRYRVEQLLEVERVRSRIATELHDDIGSSLSQIAIQSEVVRRRVTDKDQNIQQRLAEIAETSRRLVDSMGEIVWAMQPGQQPTDDIATPMRHFAANIFTAREIDFEFRVVGAESNLPLDAASRRQIFLIFKEAVNNIVRHADCSRAEIDIAINSGGLVLTVSDNGKGMVPGNGGEGHGLANMRLRAAALGGTVTLHSRAQGGVAVTLTLQAVSPRKAIWRRFLHR